MAKNLKIFSEAGLAVLTALTLGLAVNYKPVLACAGDETGLTNCVEETSATEATEDAMVVAPAPDSSADVYESEYAAAGATLNSERFTEHSFFLAGNEVISNDWVDGINFAAGNLVQFVGSAEYAAFVGNSVQVSGSIERDAFLAGNTLELDEDAYIGRDLFAFANLMTIKSNLYGNVFIAGDRLVLENVTITGDVSANFSEIVIKGRSAISGNFKYNEDTVITGLENLTAGSSETYDSSAVGASFATTFTDKLVGFVGGLILAFVLIALMPKFSKKLLDSFVWATSWKHLALGLGLIVLVPLCAIFVAVTIVGLPLGLMALGLYFFFICVAKYIAGGILGDQLAKSLFKKPKLNLYAKYALGSTLVFLLGLIPVVGELITAVALCFGFGYLGKRVFIHK